MGNIIDGYDQAAMTRGNISEQMKSNVNAGGATPAANSAAHAHQKPGEYSSAAPFNPHTL